VAIFEIKVNLERTAAAVERLAAAVERIADFLIPKPVSRPAKKPVPRGIVRVISDRMIWERQQLVKILRGQGLSLKEITEKLAQLQSEEREADFLQQSEDRRTETSEP